MCGRWEGTKLWSENLKVKDHSEDQGVDGRIIVKWLLGIRVGNCEIDSCHSG
jgi:hypothetical protein